MARRQNQEAPLTRWVVRKREQEVEKGASEVGPAAKKTPIFVGAAHEESEDISLRTIEMERKDQQFARQ